MNAFDKVIGYDEIKKELLQICDMIHNKEIYEKLGAKIPKGILLYGDPGLGKTLFAKCFVEECDLKSYVIRKNSKRRDFIKEIANTFHEAKKNSPAIVFLDDMDKFANEDSSRRDAEEYVTIQAGIDEVADADVFVIATINDIYKLPSSLTRAGRFDRKIRVKYPSDDTLTNIAKHYLQNKPIANDIELDDFGKMLNYNSCAEIEAIINEATINAAYMRKDKVSKSELVDAVLKMEYGVVDDCINITAEELYKIALHEAGHAVVCEMLCPGSVGIVSIRKKGWSDIGGFTKRCKDLPQKIYYAIVSLAGKAATELFYSEVCADGCQSDIDSALKVVRSEMADKGKYGLSWIDINTRNRPTFDKKLDERNEMVALAELERCHMSAKDILIKNREFLEEIAEALIERETLLNSDIRCIKEACKKI